MANGYMPRRDAEALEWLQLFVGRLIERPEVYHLGADETAGPHEAVMRFAQAYRVATNPSTRTQLAVRAKDQARADAETACQPLYARVKADRRISDLDKLAIGVKPINAARTRIKAPETFPKLSLKDTPYEKHTLLFQDSGATDSLAKPAGAVQVQLFRAVADEQTDELSYYGAYSRGPIVIALDPRHHGKFATYRARWITRRGETGPWGPALCLPIFATAPLFDQQRQREALAA